MMLRAWSPTYHKYHQVSEADKTWGGLRSLRQARCILFRVNNCGMFIHECQSSRLDNH